MAYYLFEFPDDFEMQLSQPQKKYVRDSKAMARTAVDVRELPESYEFIADMPGMKPTDIKVKLENENVLKINGTRKREEATQDLKYLKIERTSGDYMRRFTLPDDANKDAISAAYKDGILTVTVPKIAPPKPNMPRTIEVKAA